MGSTWDWSVIPEHAQLPRFFSPPELRRALGGIHSAEKFIGYVDESADEDKAPLYRWRRVLWEASQCRAWADTREDRGLPLMAFLAKRDILPGRRGQQHRHIMIREGEGMHLPCAVLARAVRLTAEELTLLIYDPLKVAEKYILEIAARGVEGMVLLP